MNILASILLFSFSANAQAPSLYGITPPSYTFEINGLEQSSDILEEEEDDLEEELESGDGYAKRKKGNSPLIDDKKQVIKTLQKKTFLKMKRWEASPHIAFVPNDPFLRRYIIGAGMTYNFTEIFAIEGDINYSPDLDKADWKPLTTQLVEENSVSPDISKMLVFGSTNFVYSPIYGKAAVIGKQIILFDIYGKFGLGFVQTKDDLTALQKEDDPQAISTEVQIHATTNLGGGARVIFNENVASRLEIYSMQYIETIDGTTLEMKNNLVIQLSGCIFFPAIQAE
jgi:outer membrane beta-barrel protein